MDRLLPSGTAGEARVFEAMRYSSLGGGKRLRAFRCWPGATLFKVSPLPALRTASAIEFVQAYSLIHDDLPAMDDDDLRRGKAFVPSSVRRGDGHPGGRRAAGIGLRGAGHEDTHGDPAVRVGLVAELAKAAGARGLHGGRPDARPAGRAGRLDQSIGAITHLQRLRDGALNLVLVHGGRGSRQGQRAGAPALSMYAHDLGLAFQIVRRPARHRRESGRTGQDARQGRGGGKSHIRLDPRRRARPREGGMLAKQAARISSRSARRRVC